MIGAFIGSINKNDIDISLIQNLVEYLITQWDVDTFYVANVSSFDRACQSVLDIVRHNYDIKVCLILSGKHTKSCFKADYIIHPDNLKDTSENELSNLRRWLLDNSDIIASYIRDIELYKLLLHEAKNGKKIINIGN